MALTGQLSRQAPQKVQFSVRIALSSIISMPTNRQLSTQFPHPVQTSSSINILIYSII